MRGLAIVAGVAAGVALLAQMPAAYAMNEVFGGPQDDQLTGTHGADLIGGRGGDDVIRPIGGSDIVRAGRGDDSIFLRNDGAVDRIQCGPGFDLVAYHFSVDHHDIINPNCEGVIA